MKIKHWSLGWWPWYPTRWSEGKRRTVQREGPDTRRDNWPCWEFYSSVSQNDIYYFSVNPTQLNTHRHTNTLASDLCPLPRPTFATFIKCSQSSDLQKMNIMSRSITVLSLTLSPSKCSVMWPQPPTTGTGSRSILHLHPSSSANAAMHCAFL